jgi:large conductance mechanosensitive channel
MAMSGNSSGGFWADFRKFIMHGNVVDLAVAVIIGGAFGKIIESFVADIITPAILQPALQAANVNDLASLSAGGVKYGSFLAAVINFIVIAFSIFLMIRVLENAKKRFRREVAVEEAAAPVEPVVVSQENLTHAIERLTQVLESK